MKELAAARLATKERSPPLTRTAQVPTGSFSLGGEKEVNAT